MAVQTSIEIRNAGNPSKMDVKPIVFIVDDDPLILKVLANVIEVLGFQPRTYDTADAFLAAYQRTGPACLVLDVRVPGLSGLELQKELIAARNTLPIIFITGHADVRMAVEAMEAGAFAFLEKPFRVQEVCDKVQRAIRRDQDAWQKHERQESLNRRIAQLTVAERGVLDRVVAGQANKTIAMELGLSVRTIEVHRARMMKKLGVKCRNDLLTLMLSGTGS